MSLLVPQGRRGCLLVLRVLYHNQGLSTISICVKVLCSVLTLPYCSQLVYLVKHFSSAA